MVKSDISDRTRTLAPWLEAVAREVDAIEEIEERIADTPETHGFMLEHLAERREMHVARYRMAKGRLDAMTGRVIQEDHRMAVRASDVKKAAEAQKVALKSRERALRSPRAPQGKGPEPVVRWGSREPVQMDMGPREAMA